MPLYIFIHRKENFYMESNEDIKQSLKKEIMLEICESLYNNGVIPYDVFLQMNSQIVE